MDLLVQRPDQGERPLPPGMQIVKVFDAMEQLLILGAPGSGKTTLLLELARDLIDRAARDPTHPIPVVFPLSTWAESRRPLAEWLVEELYQRYDVSRKIGQPWVEADQILPFLDGLDEVKPEHRAACVEAINAFRKDHDLPLVICSRTADYQALDVPLQLYGAIVVQPLSPQQVDSYLTEIGPAGEAVRQAMSHDPMLGEMFDSPLMLNIVTVAYAGQPGSQPRLSGTLKERRDHLFGAYVDQMFRRRGAVRGYTPGQTDHWLCWLACQMASHGQTVFYLERLQFDWIPWGGRQAFRVYSRLVGGLVFGLVYGLVYGLVFGLVGGLVYGLVGGLVFGPVSRLIRGLVVGLVFGLVGGPFIGLAFGLAIGLVSGGLTVSEIETRAVPNQGIHRSARNALAIGLVGGLVYGLVVGLVFGPVVGLVVGSLIGPDGRLIRPGDRLVFGPVGGLVYGLVGGPVGGLVGGLVIGLVSGGLTVSEIETRAVPNQGIHRSAWNALAIGLVGGLVFGLVVGLFGLVFGPVDRLVYGLVFGLVIVLFYGLVGLVVVLVSRLIRGLVGGLIVRLVGGLTVSEIETRAVPNQGILRSARNALVVGLGGGLVYGLVAGLVSGLICGRAAGLAFGLINGLKFGLAFGLLVVPVYALVGGLSLSLEEDIICAETVRWSWPEARSHMPENLQTMLGSGLAFGLLIGLMVMPIGGAGSGLFGGLFGGLVIGLVIGLIRGGLTVSEIETRAVPNQGIHRSARNALVVGLFVGPVVALVSGLVGGLAFVLINGLINGLVGGLVFGLFIGLVFGPIGGLQAGGNACFRHLVLRLWLVRDGSMPWNYVKFLDYAAERILLRKVGGGYIFIHRMLLEYFAAQYDESSIEATPNAEPSHIAIEM